MRSATTVGGEFTIAGALASTYGAFLISSDIPPIPNTRDIELELDGHTGIYDSGTEISRLDVNMTIGFWTNQGLAALKQNIRNFMALIDPRNGYVTFVDSEDPNWQLNLKLTSSSGSATSLIAPGQNERAATLQLQFKCADPHWYSPTLYPLQTLPSVSTYYTTPQNLTNPGAPVPLAITLQMTGSAGLIGLNVGGHLLTIDSSALVSGNVVTINTDTWSVLFGATNYISKWAGEMPQMPSGVVAFTPVGPVQYRVAFTPRWLA